MFSNRKVKEYSSLKEWFDDEPNRIKNCVATNGRDDTTYVLGKKSFMPFNGMYKLEGSFNNTRLVSLSEQRRTIIAAAEGYREAVEKYATATLFRPENRSKETDTQILVRTDETVTPLIIFLEENPEAFKWSMEIDKKAIIDWSGIPYNNLYRPPTIHSLLDCGVRRETHNLIRFDRPILRPIPISDEEPVLSWYVGYIVQKPE
jgi:hypothetical protein